MSAVLTQITQAVTDLLNGNTLSLPFTAIRTYMPNYDLSTSPGLQVFVLGVDQAVDLDKGTRSQSMDTYTVALGIYSQVSRSGEQFDQTSLDNLLYFVQQVIDLLKANKEIAVTGNSGMLMRLEHGNGLAYDPVRLETKMTFVSVLTADYRLMR